jgi:hypothetical protein
MNESSSSRWDYEVRLLAWLAVCVSVFSFLYYFRRGDVLLYGDAVAHINIARRVFDSKTPGLLQLGTVWLPLPHLLMVPFLVFDGMWRNGVAGTIPSMAAYVFGVVGIFRLVRGAVPTGLLSLRDAPGHLRAGLSHSAATRLKPGVSPGSALAQKRSSLNRGEGETAARVAGWIAVLIFGANPNLIYMQSTAMGEVLYLYFFIWAVTYFSEFVEGDAKALKKCGFSLAATCLTRYDGWLLAAAVVAGVVVVSVCCGKQRAAGKSRLSATRFSASVERAALAKFILISVAGPLLWLGYNAAVYRNPLEFANGPYSPKAIEQKTRTVNPAKGNFYAAALYFLKAAELNVAESALVGHLWLALAALASVGILATARWSWPVLLLWVPLPFYPVSIAYGGVPIFVPSWWPFSLYNVRYGLELLPALSATLGVLFYVAMKRGYGILRGIAALAMIMIVAAGYASVWRAEPICLREAVVNSRGRIALERQLADWLKKLPPDSTLLMYLGEHPGAVEQAGIPLKRVINEGNHRVWMQPSDPEGLWERALAAPEEFSDYVVAFEGDSVWAATQGRGLKELVEIKVTGQPRAVLFRAR